MASSVLMHHRILCCNPWSVRPRPAIPVSRRPSALEARAEKTSSGGSSSSSSRREETLWRGELSSKTSWPEDWSPQEEEEEEEKKEAAVVSSRRSGKGRDAEKGGVMEILGSFVEKLLVADFFFILFILAWFLAGLAEKAAFDTSTLIDAWLALWSIVFQPALGFFMAGALWTAVSKNFLRR